MTTLTDRALTSLAACGADLPVPGAGPTVTSRSPIDGSVLATVAAVDAAGMAAAVERAHDAFLTWRTTRTWSSSRSARSAARPSARCRR